MMNFKTTGKILTERIYVSSLKKQVTTGLIIGIVVILILLLFQPFGTFEFKMKGKYLFLSGYGIICSVIYIGYYGLLMGVLKKWFSPQKWNFIRELITVIPLLMLLSTTALLYHHAILGGYDIRFSDVVYFFKISLAVALIPFSILLYRKYNISNLTTVTPEKNSDDYIIHIDSSNKKEKPISTKASNLVYIKSNGNYIDVTVWENGKIKTSLLRNTLNQVEGKLSENDFIKIHRSYIINKSLIDSMNIQGSSYFVKIKNSDLNIPVSRSNIKIVKGLIG